MEFIEYKKASLRHYKTCVFLCEEIKKLNDSPTNIQKKQTLMHNIYYLSGYIVETLLSYIFFVTIKYRGKIEDSEHYKSNDFKTHDLNKKIFYLKRYDCFIDGIPFIGKKESNKKYTLLFNRWSVNLRYQESSSLLKIHFTEDDICGYIKELGKMKELALCRFN